MFAPADDRVLDRQLAGMEERAVTHVLEHVAIADERRGTNPLRALAAHRRDADHLTRLRAADHADHAVTPDAGTDERPVRHEQPGVVGTTGAEERCSLRLRTEHELERLGRLRWGETLRADPLEEDASKRLDERVGGERARRGHECPAGGVLLAGDRRRRAAAVQRGANPSLEPLELVLDHEHGRGAGGQPPRRPLVERVEHAELQHAHTEVVQFAPVEPEDAQCFQHHLGDVPRRDDAEPCVGWVDDHRVEVVLGDVSGDHLPAVAGELLLDDEGMRGTDAVRERRLPHATVDFDDRNRRSHAVGRDRGEAGAIGDGRDDLHRDPRARCPRQGESVQTEIDDVLDRAGVHDREVEPGERDVRTRRERRRLACRVVADEREHAAQTAGAGVVAVTDRVAGTVEAGGLPVPDPGDAVVRMRGERHRQSGCPSPPSPPAPR